ncbi:MAG: energy-coupling factor transporter ATPase [Erysipelotrichaceae bacterium]|nr:energy-coupling factor transporter ATPase [Erysipelotrichaceae bacterium]
MKCLEVKNLSFSYEDGYQAVKNVSFDVEEGTYTTIIGHNGSGKSTVAKLIMGLLEKAEGTILVEGIELNLENLRKIRNKVGIVFQNPDNQFIGSTVRDDIAFGLENHMVEPAKMDGIIEEFAARVKMTEYLNHEPTRLSGGQKQRVAIAGVMAMAPHLIIFDEATSMLDPQGKEEIKKVMMSLHNEQQVTIISITHDIEEVAMSDHVIVMNKGEIAMDGKPEDVLKHSKELISMSLDVPFSCKAAEAFNRAGIPVNNAMSIEGLVNEVCRLNSDN